MQTFRKLITMLSLAIFLAVSVPSVAFANETGTEEGDDISTVVDLIVLRPIGVIATITGLVIFVGSLPISIPTLSVPKTFNALVVNPARYTFVRKIGETQMVDE